MNGASHEFTPAHVSLPDSSLPGEEVTMGHLKHTIRIDAPVDKVWKFSHDPHNWATFMVGMSEPGKITGDGGVGTQIDFTVLMLGWHLNEICRVVEERRDPDGSGHWRGDFTGPSSGWMTMDFKPESGGTLVAQEMEYTVPGSVLGKVVDRVIYEKRQDWDMLRSLENLKLLMEESWSPPARWDEHD